MNGPRDYRPGEVSQRWRNTMQHPIRAECRRNATSESAYKTETDLENKLTVAREGGRMWEGTVGKFGMDVFI